MVLRNSISPYHLKTTYIAILNLSHQEIVTSYERFNEPSSGFLLGGIGLLLSIIIFIIKNVNSGFGTISYLILSTLFYGLAYDDKNPIPIGINAVFPILSALFLHS